MTHHRLAVAFALLLAPGCKDKGKSAPAEQSFREGLELLCSAGEQKELASLNPAERQAAISEWIRKRVRNPEVIAVFSGVAAAAPDERAAVLDDAARRAGLTDCPLATPADDAFAGVTLPEVGDARLETLVSRHATLTATKTAIVVEGDEIAPIRDGHVEGDRLATFLAALAASPSGGGGLTVALDASTPFGLFMELLTAARPAYTSFQVVVRNRTEVGAIPIVLAAAAAAPPKATGLVVSITTAQLLVWSLSGQEGSLQDPALVAPAVDLTAAVATMQRTLVEIAARHLGESRLVIMADRSLPMATVAPLMAAARRTPDGAPLFDHLVLSTGFE